MERSLRSDGQTFYRRLSYKGDVDLEAASIAAESLRDATTGLPTLASEIEALATKAGELPLHELVKSTATLVMTVDELAVSEAMAAIRQTLTSALDEIRGLTKTIRDGGLLEDAAERTRTTIEALEVSFPLHAQGQEIPFAEASGAIRTDQRSVWADTPSRAISLSLAESLSKLTGSVTAVEPWPLDEPAAVKLDVRVKKLLASAEGSLEF